MKYYILVIAALSLFNSLAFAGQTDDTIDLTNAVENTEASSSNAGASSSYAAANRLALTLFNKEKQEQKIADEKEREKMEKEMKESYQILPEEPSELKEMMTHFVNTYFHMYESPHADQYFLNSDSVSWSSETKYMKLTVTQKKENPMQLIVNWDIRNGKYSALPTDKKVKLVWKASTRLRNEKEVLLNPEGSVKKAVIDMDVKQVRKMITNHKYLKVKIKDGNLELASVVLPFSSLKFSFHTKELLDQKGKCSYLIRLSSLRAEGIISQEVFDHLRNHMENYCVVPA